MLKKNIYILRGRICLLLLVTFIVGLLEIIIPLNRMGTGINNTIFSRNFLKEFCISFILTLLCWSDLRSFLWSDKLLGYTPTLSSKRNIICILITYLIVFFDRTSSSGTFVSFKILHQVKYLRKIIICVPKNVGSTITHLIICATNLF